RDARAYRPPRLCRAALRLGGHRHTMQRCLAQSMASSRILTGVPVLLDRAPSSAFRRLVVVALGITWILDGLEVTLAGSVAAALQTRPRAELHAALPRLDV